MWVQECFCVWVHRVCVRVRSSLIFSHANEGVGAKITRPIFPPPQWGHYLLMFCIFPPPSHSHAFFILSLLLGSSHCHPVTIFPVLSAIIKAQRVYNHQGPNREAACVVRLQKIIMMNWWKMSVKWIVKKSISVSVKFLNIAFQMQVGFVSNHKYFPKTHTFC